MTPLEKQLMLDYPLMKCANRLEFQHRLQWLSEGVLRNFMLNIYPWTFDQNEIEIYRKFKEARDAASASTRSNRNEPA